MNTGANNYDLLITKLDEFIRKYYKNQLIKGVIYTFTLLLAGWLLFAIVEYFGYFPVLVRSILFLSFLAGAMAIAGKLIVVPLIKLYKLGKIISHEDAAEIIGKHFEGVRDKLLNTLQLKAQAESSESGQELILAGIDQKISHLKPIPFTSAIDLRKNKKYARYAVIPLSVVGILLLASPGVLFEGSERLVKFNTQFEKPAPFSFIINQSELKAVQSDDFLLNVEVNGDALPAEVYIETSGHQFRLIKKNNTSFEYTFNNLQNTTRFRLLANGVSSKDYVLEVVPKPVIAGFSVTLDYPTYINKPAEKMRNTGDLTVPAGTKITWLFTSRNVDELLLNDGDTTFSIQPDDNGAVTYSKTAVKSTSYAVSAANKYITGKDSMRYLLNVIPDLHPSIQIEQQTDSFTTQLLYFKGIIRDDYGFSKLRFAYKFVKPSEENPRPKETVYTNITCAKNVSQDQFFHSWNMQPLFVEPGEEIEYFFEIWDNDGFSGPKVSRSQSMVFKAPSLKELAEKADDNSDKMKDDLESSILEASKLQRDLNKTSKEMLEKKSLNYDDKKKIEELLKRQKELESKVTNMQKQNKMNNSREQEYRRSSEDILEKKQQLDELFDKLMSEEMKEMMRELEKLMSELDKEELRDMVDKMKLDNEDLEKQLDRTLELFKQLEVEQKLKESIEDLRKLAEEQKKLAEKSEESKSSESEELKKEQEKISEKFDELAKNLDDIEKKNEELEFPQEIPDTESDESDIQEDMEKSEEELGESKPKKASESQKGASEKMEDMANKMEMQMQQNSQQQAEEDMAALRELLENLIQFSFSQEQLMQDLKNINPNNPQYTKMAQRQRELLDDAKVLEDSLQALSKRVAQIQSLVNTEIAAINDNLAKSIGHMQDRQIPQTRSDQQYVMTSVNNLALMLSEAFDQMQQQMAESKGMGNCKKPGSSGKPSPSSEQMRQMQQKLNEQMKALKSKMDGKKKGEEGKGKGSGQRGNGMSEELARLAAQQEALRNELQKLSQQQNKDGTGSLGNLDKLAKQMEETEKDLVNRQISQETLARQEEILTRLLESEKAERERDQDNKRESNEFPDLITRNPGQFEEYKKLKMKEAELLKTIPTSLNGFYKNLVNSYFQTLEN